VLAAGSAPIIDELAGYLATADNRLQRAVISSARRQRKSKMLGLLTAYSAARRTSPASPSTQ
jgi:hypothetical protein